MRLDIQGGIGDEICMRVGIQGADWLIDHSQWSAYKWKEWVPYDGI